MLNFNQNKFGILKIMSKIYVENFEHEYSTKHIGPCGHRRGNFTANGVSKDCYIHL